MSEITEADAGGEAPLPAMGVFAGLSARVRGVLSEAGRFETLQKGHYLATQGEPHSTMSFLLSGAMDVYVRAHADTLHVAEVKPGETVGEMNIIDPSDRASADVVVAEPSLVFSVTETDFLALVDRDPMAGFAIIKALGRELCQRLRKGSEAMLRQAEENRSNFRDMDY